MSGELLQLLDELRVIAENGLTYAENPHDRERYERIEELVAAYYGKALDLPPEDARERLAGELGHVTQKVGANAAVINDSGEILLEARQGENTWGLPGGWVEPCESSTEATVRETREETGLDIDIVELVDIYEIPPDNQYHVHSQINHLYLCTSIGGTLRPSYESTDVQYWSIADVPAWHVCHAEYANDAYELWDQRRRQPSN